MELHDALSRIQDIRTQITRTNRFRGYGPAATAATSIAALVAGFWQSTHISATDPLDAVNLWSAIATASVALVAIEMLRRCRHSPLQRELTLQAIEQFLPCLLLGGLLTIVLSRDDSTSISLLPGLWQILFAMGIFASRRLLPASIVLIGAFYAAFGLFNLYQSEAANAFAWWRMAIPFGLGQAATAAILHFSMEEHRDPQT